MSCDPRKDYLCAACKAGNCLEGGCLEAWDCSHPCESARRASGKKLSEETLQIVIDHELKTWPGPFAAVWDRRKTFEIRERDRDFKEVDAVWLHEWEPIEGRYTGRSVLVEITYIAQRGAWGIPENRCIFGFREITRMARSRGR